MTQAHSKVIDRINAIHNELARAHFDGYDLRCAWLCIRVAAMHVALAVGSVVKWTK